MLFNEPWHGLWVLVKMGMLGQEIELLKENCDKNGVFDFLSLELLEEKLKYPHKKLPSKNL